MQAHARQVSFPEGFLVSMRAFIFGPTDRVVHMCYIISLTIQKNALKPLNLAGMLIRPCVVDLLHRIIVSAPLNGSGAICKRDQFQTMECFTEAGTVYLLERQCRTMNYQIKTMSNINEMIYVV